MRLKVVWKSDTLVNLNIEASDQELAKYKKQVLSKLAPQVKVAGFRAGHVPAEIVEKHLDQQVLQSEFLDLAMTELYTAAAKSEHLRPVSNPKVTVKKFVPFTQLEFELEVPCVGEIKLPDYKKITLPRPKVSVTEKDINEVIENLRTRAATKQEVKRASKNDDEVVIDFTGKDKEGKPIAGADGKDYPLILGSNTFIPGFEPELVGLKSGDDKKFTVKFPKDYGVSSLQNKDVLFEVKVKKVNEVVRPKADDEFAKQSGPFKSFADLKADIKTQLTLEREENAKRDHEAAVVRAVSEKSKVAIPEELINEQIERMDAEERQNLIYRGQTWEEHLKAEGVSEEEHSAKKRPEAEERVKVGLVLSEIADKEKLNITPEELDQRISLLKTQYTDPRMQAELDKTENRREIAARMLSEKTVALLTKG